MAWLQSLAAEFAIAVFDGGVWLGVGESLIFGAACLLVGTSVSRLVGLLPSSAQAGETVGVGLASGLLVVAAWWAALVSGGRSSFTPVAVGFAFAVALGLASKARSARTGEHAEAARAQAAVPAASRWSRNRPLLMALVAGGAFVIAVALLYASTIAPSPRDGLQPIAVQDEAFYSILGADLARTGTETIYSPSGLSAVNGLPPQAWYHWGEMWLASALIRLVGTEPLAARHFVVLPLMVLAAAALTGTLVRRVTGSASPGAFLFGFLACLFLAPVPFIPGPFFSSWADGLIFGITLYGLAAVAVLLVLYILVVMHRRKVTAALACFVASASTLIVPAHVVVALLGFVGLASVWALRTLRSLADARDIPFVAPVWRTTLIATAIALTTTVAWGLLTGHGIGGSGLSPSVAPFNATWRESVAITAACSGAFAAIGVAWLPIRREASVEANLYLGTGALLIVGALAWGARLGDFNMAHLFFAGIVVFATPVAAVAVWSIWVRLRGTGHRRVAIIVLVLSGAQIAFGMAISVVRLDSFGPNEAPVPMAILAGIRNLPIDAKLAYACRPSEEIAYWDSRLLGIDAHTGRRVVPMCFQAEAFSRFIGSGSGDIPNPLFQSAPQRALYPDSSARPTPANVARFLKDNGIHYIYVDARHPNTLVPDAIPILTAGLAQILRIP
jgi:hypothetical protein